jgi:signal peptidase I
VFVVALALMAMTIYALPLALAVWAASLVDIVVYVARKKPAKDTVAALVVWGIAYSGAALARQFVAQAFKIPSSAMEPTFHIGDHIFVTKLRAPERGDIAVFQQPCQPERDYIKRIVALENDTVEVRCGVLYVNAKRITGELVKADDGYRDMNEMDGLWFERRAARYRETLGGKTYDVFGSADRDDDALRDFPQEIAPSCASQPDFPQPSSVQQPGKIVETNAAPADPCTPHRHFVVPPGHVFGMGDNRHNSNDSRYWGAIPVAYIRGTVTGIWLPVARFGSVD